MQPSSHLSPDVLSAYILGRLPWERFTEVQGHLDTCNDCKGQLRSLEHASDSFVALMRGPLPDPTKDGPVARPDRACPALARRHREARAATGPRGVAGLEVVKELAAGGLGIVYLARNPGLDHREQAVKLLLPEHRGNVDLLARFQREKRAIARIKDKQHVVEIFDAGRDETEGPYLVMEYLDGESLKQLIARHGPLPIAEACELVRRQRWA